MRDLVDTIIGPLLRWLTDIYNRIHSLSVPLARPLHLSDYFGYFKFLGPYWQTCITTSVALVVLYLLVFIIVKNIGLIMKFKELIKFW